MYIISGATGHVGSVVAQQLLNRGEVVTVLIRDDKKAADWKKKGAQIAFADVRDVDALKKALHGHERLFLMLPPGDITADALQEECKILDNYQTALKDSGIHKVVGLSSYGAQAQGNTGSLKVSRMLEEVLDDLPLKKSFVRPAYYFSNWEMGLKAVQNEGILHTFYPPDLKIPMVSPRDNGEFCASILAEPLDVEQTYQIEGPKYYSSDDVAAVLSNVLGKNVNAVEIKPTEWKPTMLQMGFSPTSADQFIAMTKSVTESNAEADPNFPVHKGSITLKQYFRELLDRN